ncbi:unnamed protein product [Cutaneotrichosporon oleaginosum]
MNVLTGMALRAAGGTVADKQKVTSALPCSSSTNLPRPPFVLPQERWHTEAPFVRGSSKALPIHPTDMARALDLVNEALLTNPRATAVQFGSIAAGILINGRPQSGESHSRGFGAASILHELLGLPPPRADAQLAEATSEDEVDSGTDSPHDEKREDSAERKDAGDNKETKGDSVKAKRPPLPRGLDRLGPYTAHVLPVDIDLGLAKYTYEGRTDGLSTLAARGQVAMSNWNERRGSRSLTGVKRKKLVGQSIWFVVV